MEPAYYSSNHHCSQKELARAYIPYQHSHELFKPKEALMKGTVFPELYKPYHKKECRHNYCRTY